MENQANSRENPYNKGFSPPDSDGFRSFSMCRESDGAEVIRVSVHMERYRDGIKDESVRLNASGIEMPRFVLAEKEALWIAAAIARARKDLSPVPTQEMAVMAMREAFLVYAIRQFEECFPYLASFFLEVASDIVVKSTLNSFLRLKDGPQIYDAEYVASIASQFKKLLAGSLRIEKKRPVEICQQIERIRKAIAELKKDTDAMERLSGGTPTSEDIVAYIDDAEEKKPDARTVERWAEKLDLKWAMYLSLCGWQPVSEKDNI